MCSFLYKGNCYIHQVIFSFVNSAQKKDPFEQSDDNVFSVKLNSSVKLYLEKNQLYLHQ